MDNDSNKYYGQRYKLWISAFIQISFLGGVAYSWANLEQILEREGYWVNDVNKDTKYGLLYTVGSWCCQAGRVFVGIYLDLFGIRVTTVTACVMSVFGLFLFAISNTGMNLIYPAFILISLGGPGVQLATQNVSSLFHSKAMVMSSLSWASQFSTLWLQLCNVLNKTGIDASMLFAIYAAVAAALGIWCCWMWPNKFEIPNGIVEKAGPVQGRRSMLITSGRYHKKFLENGTLWQMMISDDFVYLIIYYSFQLLFLQFYIMTVGTQTELVCGKNLAVEFTIALYTVSASGILVGYTMDKLGFGFIVLFNTALSIAAALCITSHDKEVLILGFVLYALSRTTTYSMFFSFIGINFGFLHFGTLVGMGMFISGCFSIFQYLCLHIIKYDLANDYYWMNMFWALWCAVWGVLYALWLFSLELKKDTPATEILVIDEQKNNGLPNRKAMNTTCSVIV